MEMLFRKRISMGHNLLVPCFPLLKVSPEITREELTQKILSSPLLLVSWKCQLCLTMAVLGMVLVAQGGWKQQTATIMPSRKSFDQGIQTFLELIDCRNNGSALLLWFPLIRGHARQSARLPGHKLCSALLRGRKKTKQLLRKSTGREPKGCTFIATQASHKTLQKC